MRYPRMKIASILICALAMAACGQQEASAPPSGKSEILWDKWGVPHIYGETADAASYAYGWAQMKGHADILLELFGASRGRAAEYWGEQHAESDIYLHKLGVPERAAALYAAQGAEYQARLDAFVAGMNDYAARNPDEIADDKRQVLPIRAEDVLAHIQVSLHLTFIAGRAPSASKQWAGEEELGSNAWAISPGNSASGNAMLLANPHLPWSGLYLFHEAQIEAPGYNAYGTTLIGWPFLVIAFNDNLGWTHTVNTYDGADIYELTLVDGGYLLDGEVKAFESREQTIKIRREDGDFEDRKFTVRRSVHGPIIGEREGQALAIRIAGFEEPGRSSILEQYWNMGAARNLDEFEAALSVLQMPMFNVVYADRHGDIFYAFNALQPVRSSGDVDFWAGIVDGGDSALLWQGYRSYDELPKYRNPTGGFVQNSNDPPWTSSFPQMLKAADFPPDTAPQGMPFRPQSGAGMLLADDSISFDELIAYRGSSRLILADAVLDDLIAAARADGDATAGQAAAVLESWDRQARADSRGAALFQAWVIELGPESVVNGGLFKEPWTPERPLETPRGLADAAGAVAALKKAADTLGGQFGSLDVPWGDVTRIRHAGKDLPASVGPGLLGAIRVGFLAPKENGQFDVLGGNSFVAVIEFGERIKARAILAYGNASQTSSPHFGDQLELFSRGDLREVWFYRADVEANSLSREDLDYTP